MSARTILKHLHQQGRMTDYQFDVINRNLKARPQGEWMHSKDGCLCTNCDRPVAYDDCGDRFLSDYCPWCGADMRGGRQ